MKNIFKFIIFSLIISYSSNIFGQTYWNVAGNTGSSNIFGQTDNYPLHFYTNNTEKMTLATTGDLGLGTTSPAGRIHLHNPNTNAVGIRFTNTASTNNGFIVSISNTSDAWLCQNEAKAIRFMTNESSNERMRIDAAGNVGIGVNASMGNTNARTKFHLHSTTDTTWFQITNNTTTNAAAKGLKIGMNTTGGENYADFNNRENGAMRFSTNNTERMRVLKTGQVNIGDGSTPLTNADARMYINNPSNGFSYSLKIENDKTSAYSILALSKRRGIYSLTDDATNTDDSNIAFYGSAENSYKTVGIDVTANNATFQNIAGHFACSNGVDNDNIESIGAYCLGESDGVYSPDGSINIGVKGEGKFSNYENYGGRFYANSSDQTAKNIGVYCTATGGNSSNRWAAWFEGSTYCNNGTYQPSDSLFKENIIDIKNSLEKIKQLKPRNYKMKKNQYPLLGFEDDFHYGFIAQEIEKIFPSLIKNTTTPVKRDSLHNTIQESIKFKTLNYIELIPITIQAIKELDSINIELINKNTELENRLATIEAKLDDLTKGKNNKSIKTNNNTDVELTSSFEIVLDQNSPNPFSEQTVIAYVLPVSVKSAKMMFYTETGVIIKSVDIAERGEGKVTVYASNLSSGIYTYCLIADGKTIDCKKMQCSK